MIIGRDQRSRLQLFVFIRVNSLLDSAQTNYGIRWWMRLRWDTIRVEESAICIGRLSLHRLPPKRGRASRGVGLGTAPGFGSDKGRAAQDSVRESDSFVCRVLRHAFVFRGQQGFRRDRCHDCIAGRSGAICAAESNFPRRQIAVGCHRQVAPVVSDSPEESELTTDNTDSTDFGWQPLWLAPAAATRAKVPLESISFYERRSI